MGVWTPRTSPSFRDDMEPTMGTVEHDAFFQALNSLISGCRGWKSSPFWKNMLSKNNESFKLHTFLNCINNMLYEYNNIIYP